jgi:hypothetical protein
MAPAPAVKRPRQLYNASVSRTATVSAALRQPKQYSASVRCTASASVPQILAVHNGKTRVTIGYRQPLPPARSLHRSSICAPISQSCTHDLFFGFQISTA